MCFGSVRCVSLNCMFLLTRRVRCRRASVVSVSAMVHKFKDTKLSSVALKSDKVRTNYRELSSDW